MAVTSIKDHGNYQKYKEHPLVVLLMKCYREQSEKVIPEVWISFIRKSTPESDMVLMSSQLAKWGIQGGLDDALRGEELLSFIMDSRALRYLLEADQHSGNTGCEWPKALEYILTAHRITPSEIQRKTYEYADIYMRADVNYVETGTLKYTIQRRIPGVVINIPAQWIIENCGPEHSDGRLMANYREGQVNMFQLRGESKIKTRGFALLEKIKSLLESSTPRDLFDTDSLSSSLNRLFPNRINGAQWDEEPQFAIEVHDPKPDPLKYGTDVIRKNVMFTDCHGRRNTPKITKMLFPVFSTEMRDKFARKNIQRPSAITEFEAPVMSEDETGEMTPTRFIGKLRGIYEKLEAVRSYNEARKGIKD
jgi:hypothetical protein